MRSGGFWSAGLAAALTESSRRRARGVRLPPAHWALQSQLPSKAHSEWRAPKCPGQLAHPGRLDAQCR